MKYLVQNPLYRIYSSRNEREQILILSTLFSLGLQAFRVLYTGQLLFSFLVWNLFLAFIPYVISSKMATWTQQLNKWKVLLLAFAWLLFVPNSFYIITDLFHLDMNSGVPLWYDLALLLAFAWNGLLFGIVSVRQMEKAFEAWFNKKFDLLFILPVMFLNGLGVYVGRYLRFNSWDVITNPLQLTSDIIYLFIHPIRNRFDWSMIVCYSLLMTIIYITVKKLARAFNN
jgi:uncharacterized membrane protein